DPAERFSRSLFLSSTLKFMPKYRAMEFVPGGTEKVCDCPATFFSTVERRGYEDFLNPRSKSLINTRDTFTLAIDILYRLGFRTIYCVGTEMRIRPSEAQA